MSGGLRPIYARYRLVVSLAILAVLAAVYVIQTGGSITASPSTGPTDVAIIKAAGTSVSETEIRQMVRDAVAAAGGLESIIQPGDNVVVHPNVVNTVFTSGGGVVTDCRVTREVVRIAQELAGPTGQVVIGEGTAHFRDGEYSADRSPTWKAFHDAGYDANWDKYDDVTGAQLVDFNNAGQTWPDYPSYSGPYPSAYVTKKTLTNNLLKTEYWLNNTLVNADVVIKVPVMKNHELAGVTGALKLAVGTAPNDIYHYWGPTYKVALLHNTVHGYSSEYENNARAIVDLNRCKPTSFVVMDALMCVTNGPVGHGQPVATRWFGCILAGKDMVAVDTIESLIMGYNPSSVRHLVLASQAPALLGTMDTSLINVKGTHVAEVKQKIYEVDPPDYVGAMPGDVVGPAVTAIYPSSGSTVSGTVSITAAGISDNMGQTALLKAELYVDGNLVDTDTVLENSSYAFSWDSSSVADGMHALNVIVYDRSYNESGAGTAPNKKGGHTVNVNVNNSGNWIANALANPDGSSVSAGQLVVTYGTVDGYFYAEQPNRTMGLKIKSSNPYTEGNLIDVTGVMAGAGVERYLNASSVNVINPSVSVPEPLMMNNLSVGGSALNPLTPGVESGAGPYNLGLLVKTTGKVVVPGTGFFYITDGSRKPDGSTALVMVSCPGLSVPSNGDFVSVTGISIPVSGQSVARGIAARKPADIVVYPR